MMKSISTWKQELTEGAHAARLAALYCCTPNETPAQAARYAAVLDGLETTFGAHTEAGLYSAPGRTEIGGNHTDHQHGRVIAAAVDMETTAEVTLNGTNIIRVDSEGYKPVEIGLNDLSVKESEKNTTAALIRGVAAAFPFASYELSDRCLLYTSPSPRDTR